MKIKQLTLFTNNLDQQNIFYKNFAESNFITESKNEFTINIGWTELKFKASITNYKYHYCFLIPSNKLEEAINHIIALSQTQDLSRNQEIKILCHFVVP